MFTAKTLYSVYAYKNKLRGIVDPHIVPVRTEPAARDHMTALNNAVSEGKARKQMECGGYDTAYLRKTYESPVIVTTQSEIKPCFCVGIAELGIMRQQDIIQCI